MEVPDMMIVFDNPVMHVVDYPAQDAVEVIDKRVNKGVLMRNGAAERFRAELKALVSGEPDIEAFGDLLEEYGSLITQPAVYH
ncbi:MAG: hypothetical protein BroJett006_04480 [Betaproteobacteria bacterium]|jgi:hypothetical protein|nr:MAG: hypothetical protein BroJett006_04480 [Betaproteobacteria bacterium]